MGPAKTAKPHSSMHMCTACKLDGLAIDIGSSTAQREAAQKVKEHSVTAPTSAYIELLHTLYFSMMSLLDRRRTLKLAGWRAQQRHPDQLPSLSASAYTRSRSAQRPGGRLNSAQAEVCRDQPLALTARREVNERAFRPRRPKMYLFVDCSQTAPTAGPILGASRTARRRPRTV